MDTDYKDMANTIVSSSSPYVIGRPIYEKDCFFGRDDLFKFITDNLTQKSKVILLHGQRRIGKSSVLAQIPNFVQLESFIFIPLSLEGQASKSLGDLLSELARDIVDQLKKHADRFKYDLPRPERYAFRDCPEKFSEVFLLQVYKSVGDVSLVLLLDEFDVLEEITTNTSIENFFHYLRKILTEHLNLYAIPVVGRRLDELSRLLNVFDRAPYYEVGLLDSRAAKDLILKPAEYLLQYSPESIASILDLTSGHPYLTQVLCYAIFTNLREDARIQVTTQDVTNCIDKAIEFAGAGLTGFRNSLPISERVVFSAIAELSTDEHLTRQHEDNPLLLLKSRGVSLTENLNFAEKNLVKWNFISKKNPAEVLFAEAYEYKISVRLVSYWIKNRGFLDTDILSLEKINPDAEKFYELAEKICDRNPHQAITYYEQALKVNPNHFNSLFSMARECLGIGDYENAYVFYERAYRVDQVRSKEGFLNSLVPYSQNLLEKGEYRLAEKLAKQALNIENSNQSLVKLLNETRKKNLSEARSPLDQIQEIMIPRSELLTVTNESRFAELHYKMTSLGISHCPVIDTQSGRCLSIITRRDFVDKIPFFPSTIPEEVEKQYNINIDREKIINEIKRLGSSSIEQVFPVPQKLITLMKDDTIYKAIELFTATHLLRESSRYITALPILDSSGKPDGFISYVDIFKRFIKSQDEFLHTTLDSIVNMSKTAIYLNENTTLGEAKFLFDSTGFRSIPILKQDNSNEIVGMLESVQLKMYSHKLFTDQLINLNVKYLMTPIDRIFTPEPKTELVDFISKFWEPIDGLIRVSSFAICDVNNIGRKELRGIISYVDILVAWKKWYDNYC